MASEPAKPSPHVQSDSITHIHITTNGTLADERNAIKRPRHLYPVSQVLLIPMVIALIALVSFWIGNATDASALIPAQASASPHDAGVNPLSNLDPRPG